MNFAYVRVSTKDQNIDRQIAAIDTYCKDNHLKLDRLFTDEASGKNFEREQYKALKLCLRAGDILIVKELDRLGRNMDQIKKEWQELQEIGVEIIIIDTPILNTTNKTDLEKKLIANIVFELLSYMAEKERDKIRQRQAEGIASAKAKGKHLGRPKATRPEAWDEIYQQWNTGQLTAVMAMKMLNLKRSTFYKFIKEEREGDGNGNR